ncbi:hypothetical protein T12_5531 [Trichinella patagoniensis]|uniref:Uncharacterized protein n=1 Tax=Trichinella patagoniensis TaxID=990121 RepID=A0A0V0ZI28_9BILA|nr:hypothetical protein T12_5531 [Trichinella patagoniensis]
MDYVNPIEDEVRTDASHLKAFHTPCRLLAESLHIGFNAVRCGIVDVAGQSMQGCNRNSGSFSACTQPAESSGAGNNIQKSNPCRWSSTLTNPSATIPKSLYCDRGAGIPLNRKWPVELAERPCTPAFSSRSHVSFPNCILICHCDKRKAISMRLEEAHGRMEPYAVMELMTAVFNSPDAIPLNR